MLPIGDKYMPECAPQGKFRVIFTVPNENENPPFQSSSTEDFSSLEEAIRESEHRLQGAKPKIQNRTSLFVMIYDAEGKCQFERNSNQYAPPGRFRVQLNTWYENPPYGFGDMKDFDCLEEAIQWSETLLGSRSWVKIYDAEGKCRYERHGAEA